MTNSTEITNDLITEAIEKAIEEKTKTLVEEAKHKLDREIPSIITSVLIDLTGYSDFQFLKDKMVFTIKRNG